MFKNFQFKITLQEIVLLAITIFWGSTYLLIQHLLIFIGPLFLASTRLFIGGGCSLLASFKTITKITKGDLIMSVIIGIAIFGDYSLQTIGLKYISSSQSAFIIISYVPMVPFFQWFFTKKAPSFMMWVGIICSFIGLMLLTGYENIYTLHWNKGEIISFISAISIALETVFIAIFSPKIKNSHNAISVQLLVGSLLAFIALIIQGEHFPTQFSWKWILPLLFLGTFTYFVQALLNWALTTVSATRGTLILSIEPIWAGIVGWYVGESFPSHVISGSFLILVGMLVSELYPKKQSISE